MSQEQVDQTVLMTERIRAATAVLTSLVGRDSKSDEVAKVVAAASAFLVKQLT